MATSKQYPKRELRELTLTTVIPCEADCGRPIGVNQSAVTDEEKYWHKECAPSGGSAARVHEMKINDDLGVESK